MEPYRSSFPDAGSALPATERLAQQVLSLPSGTAISRDDVRTVSSILRLAIENGPQVSAALGRGALLES
jgi:dTDP-4-amino-4,6-dideoxyglucose